MTGNTETLAFAFLSSWSKFTKYSYKCLQMLHFTRRKMERLIKLHYVRHLVGNLSLLRLCWTRSGIFYKRFCFGKQSILKITWNNTENLTLRFLLLRDLEFYFKCVKCGKDKVSLRLPKVMLFRNLFRFVTFVVSTCLDC